MIALSHNSAISTHRMKGRAGWFRFCHQLQGHTARHSQAAAQALQNQEAPSSTLPVFSLKCDFSSTFITLLNVPLSKVWRTQLEKKHKCTGQGNSCIKAVYLLTRTAAKEYGPKGIFHVNSDSPDWYPQTWPLAWKKWPFNNIQIKPHNVMLQVLVTIYWSKGQLWIKFHYWWVAINLSHKCHWWEDLA